MICVTLRYANHFDIECYVLYGSLTFTDTCSWIAFGPLRLVQVVLEVGLVRWGTFWVDSPRAMIPF